MKPLASFFHGSAALQRRGGLRLPSISTQSLWLWLLGSLVLWGLPVDAADAAPGVLAPGPVRQDTRLGPLKDLDGYFPFEPPSTVEAWNRRAGQLRRQTLVALGLWPLPTRTPLNAFIHGRIDLGDYTVEKVRFESMPGFFVTGSLYRPKSPGLRRPAVLTPHGHWANGRFYDAGEAAARRAIETQAEQLMAAARNPLQARCVQLARMGCVVFQYDMLGYADSVQIPQAIAHGFKQQRPEMNTAEGWGLFSPQAEAHGQSVMGLQTWNSIRALDFLASLPDVDASRVGVTGASGGGTQTFILGALDPRPAAIFPAVMVSTAMQGGCTCENACGLRIGTGNVELAALFAPKPLGMTAADDWTKEMPTKGFPELQRHYARLGAPDHVTLTPLLQFGHNYNLPSRQAMYHWFNRHLQLGHPEPVTEADFERLTGEALSVWDAEHPAPAGGAEFERRLLRWWKADTDRQLEAVIEVQEAFRQVAGSGVKAVIGRDLPPVSDLDWQGQAETRPEGLHQVTGLLRHIPRGEAVPVVVLRPSSGARGVVLWLDTAGKQGLWQQGASVATPALRPEVRQLLDAGLAIVGADLLFQGESLADGAPLTETRRVKNPREAAAYTLGYNSSLFAQRVHDVLSLLAWLGSRPPAVYAGEGGGGVSVVALGGAGPWAVAARAVMGADAPPAAIDTQGFRFSQVSSIRDVAFLPGGARYFDLPGMLALAAPAWTHLSGEGSESRRLPRVLRQAYDAHPDRLVLASAALEGMPAQGAVDWIRDRLAVANGSRAVRR